MLVCNYTINNIKRLRTKVNDVIWNVLGYGNIKRFIILYCLGGMG